MKTIDELWNELHGQLLAYIKSKVHRQEDAEDILQDVFVKVYRHIETLEKADAVKSWIYQITRNTIVDFYKKKKDISTKEVQSKAKAALTYCQNATEYTIENGGKPWKYVLIPHDAVKVNMSFEYLSATYLTDTVDE